MERKRFDDVSHERPALGELKERYERLAEDMKAATASASPGLLSRWLALHDLWVGAKTLGEIGFARDMESGQHAEDKRFFDEHDGLVKEWSLRAVSALLRPPHVEVLTREQGQYFVDFLASEAQLVSPGLSDLLAKERSLVTRQEKLCAEGQRDAGSLRDELDVVFDQLVTLRAEMAAAQKLESYVPLGYRMTKLLSVTPEQTEGLRERVREEIVPWFLEVHAMREGLKSEPRLAGDVSAAFPLDAFSEVFTSLSPEIGAFHERSLEDGWCDVDDRPRMRPWAEAFMPPSERRPYVFVKLGGDWSDVPELIHETGHAFWYSTVAHDSRSAHVPAAEVDEIPSKALVYLTFPWMEAVFGDGADLYRFRKYHAGLFGLIYYCCIDELESFVHAHPTCGIAKRNQAWEDILDRFGFSEAGLHPDWRKWQVPFGAPFYTITYALAELVSQQLWKQQTQDPAHAIGNYLTLCRRSLDAPLLELLELAGLRSPFDERLCADLVRCGRAWVGELTPEAL